MLVYRVLLIVLSLISAGLYLRVILPDAAQRAPVAVSASNPAGAASTEARTESPASAPAADDSESADAAGTNAPDPVAQGESAAQTEAGRALRPLPESELRRVLAVLAPELGEVRGSGPENTVREPSSD